MSQFVLLSPHNDDAELFACFTMLRIKPHVIVCTKALVQQERGYTFVQGRDTRLITPLQREIETRDALEVLGIEYWEQWDIPDNEPDVVSAELRANVDRLSETYYHCIAPAYEEGGHNDHNDVAMAARISFGDDRVIKYLTYTRQGGRTRSLHRVPFEPHWPALKMRALACYESQIQHPSTRDHFMGDLWEWTL